MALDAAGEPTGFQKLQGRIHVLRTRDIEALGRRQPVAFIAFDLLRRGARLLTGQPFAERRRTPDYAVFDVDPMPGRPVQRRPRRRALDPRSPRPPQNSRPW